MHAIYQKFKEMSESRQLVGFILQTKNGKLAIQIGSIGEEFGELIFYNNRFKRILSHTDCKLEKYLIINVSELTITLPVEIVITEVNLTGDMKALQSAQIFY